jgi:hypothetical protein
MNFCEKVVRYRALTPATAMAWLGSVRQAERAASLAKNVRNKKARQSRASSFRIAKRLIDAAQLFS